MIKLTNKDKEYLKSIKYEENDFAQIEEAINKSTFKIFKEGNVDRYKVVDYETARDLLGDETLLNGISRSAFHYSTSRIIPHTFGKYNIHIDSGILFTNHVVEKTSDTHNPWFVLERDPDSQLIHIVTEDKNEAKKSYEVALHNFKNKGPNSDEAILLVQFFDVTKDEYSKLAALEGKKVTGCDDTFLQSFIEDDRYNTTEFYGLETDGDFDLDSVLSLRNRPCVRVTNIEWDTSCEDYEDEEDIGLPSEIIIPLEKIPEHANDLDMIVEYISDETGFCNYGGFEIECNYEVDELYKMIEKLDEALDKELDGETTWASNLECMKEEVEALICLMEEYENELNLE